MRQNQCLDPLAQRRIAPTGIVEITRPFPRWNNQGLGKNMFFRFGWFVHEDAGDMLKRRSQEGDHDGEPDAGSQSNPGGADVA